MIEGQAGVFLSVELSVYLVPGGAPCGVVCSPAPAFLDESRLLCHSPSACLSGTLSPRDLVSPPYLITPLPLLGLGTAASLPQRLPRCCPALLWTSPPFPRRWGRTSLSPSTTVWAPLGVWPAPSSSVRELFSVVASTWHPSLEDDAQPPAPFSPRSQ